MREAVTTGLELAGIGLLVAAAALIHPVAGVFAGGVALITIGWLLGRRG